MRDKRTPKDVCGEATLTEQLMKVLLYVPSPRLLFSQSRNMLSVSVIKLPLSFPYHPPPASPSPSPSHPFSHATRA